MSTQKHEGSGIGWVILFPLMIVSLVFLVLAYWLARVGSKYRLVKVFVLPAPIFLSNIMVLPVMLSATFIYSVFTGDKTIFSYAFSNAEDLTLFFIWGPIVVGFFGGDPVDTTMNILLYHALIYQLVVYALIGHRIARQLTLGIMDAAAHANASQKGVYPSDYRHFMKISDDGYAKASRYYEDRQKAPFWGIMGVVFAGGQPGTYYA